MTGFDLGQIEGWLEPTISARQRRSGGFHPPYGKRNLTLRRICHAMPNYIRVRAPGGTFFFTVTLADRSSDLLAQQIVALRAAFREVRTELPFRCDAMVVLPDHLHAVWTLPYGDTDFSTRWKRIKAGFSKSVGQHSPRTLSQQSKGEAGIWQRRFWEHCIRNADDYAAHMTYCAWNPVKHGYVKRPEDWPYSSAHRDARQGRIWWS